MRCGVQLPERADLKALPAPNRSGLAAWGNGMSQIVGDGPPANGGRIDLKAQAAMDFGSGKAVRSRRASRQEFAHECFGALRPVRRVIATRMTGSPAVLLIPGSGTKVIGIELVETGATQSEFFCGDRAEQFAAPKGGQDFTDQRIAQSVRELTIMFFIAAKMGQRQPNDQRAVPALRAFRRPPLRSGLLQARRAGSVRLCSHTCPGLNAHCSPLLATQQAKAIPNRFNPVES